MFDFSQLQAAPGVPLTQTEVNSEVKETFQVVHDWAIPVMIGLAALFLLAGFLSFMLWKGGD